MKHRKKSKKPIIFVQDCGTYSNEILVCAGGTKDDLLFYVKDKKNKVKKEFAEWLKTDDKIYRIKETNPALFAWDNSIQGHLLWLGPYDDCWEFWEALLHETAHIVQKIARDKLMSEEDEARAYLQEFLFKSIRRKLQGTDPIK